MLATLSLLLGGCPHESPPPPPAVPPTAFGVVPPPAVPPPTAKTPLVDPFGLPLVIKINPPEVPKEIIGPFPSVKEPSDKPSPPTPLPKGEGTHSPAPPKREGTKRR
jgi:hypothetical protein